MTSKSVRWKRVVGWTLAGLLAFVVIAGVGGYLFLKSVKFEQYALHKIAQEADLATGGRTEIGGLDFSLSTLTAHLYDITVRGTEAPGQPPLLHADKLTVGIRILSVLHQKVILRELAIDHPIVHLQVTSPGKNNLPAAPPSKSNGNTNLFDLGIEHVQLIGGEVNYNDRATPLDADLHDLGVNVRLSGPEKRYDGEVSYRSGRLRYAQYTPLAHSMNLKFSATPQRLELASLNLRFGSSDVVLQGGLSNYSDPVADGSYRIRIHTQDFAEMSAAVAPAGDVSLSGKLQYKAIGSRPLLQNILVSGRLASDALRVVASGRRLDIRKLEGSYLLADGNLKVSDASLESLGGTIRAAADIRHLDTSADAAVRASLHDISLQALQHSFASRELTSASLSGTLNGQAEASWKVSVSNLVGHSDLSVKALASGTGNQAGGRIPVTGAIHASYDGVHQTIAVHDTSIRIPSTVLTAQGTISSHSSLQIQVTADDLQQLNSLAASFAPADASMPAISGSATLKAVAQGSMAKPTITAQLNGNGLQFEGTQWKTASLALRATAEGIEIQRGSLVNEQRGQATFSASVGLQNWQYKLSNSIWAQLEVQQLRISDLLRAAKQQYPVSGDLSAKVSLSGSQLNPSGSGSAQIANAQAYGEPFQSLGAKFRTENGSIISTLNVKSAAGAVDLNLSYSPANKAYKVGLNAPSFVLQKLQTVQTKNLGVVGTLTASVNGEGTLDNPQLVARLELPQLQVRQKSIGQLKAEVNVTQHFAVLNLDSNVSQAAIHARGRIALSGDYQTDATIDSGTIPLGILMATYAPTAPAGFQGETEFHATFNGPLKDKSRVEAHLSIPRLKAAYQSLELGIANPIRVDYSNSVVTLQPAEIRGTGTTLRLQGRLPIGGNASPTLAAQGSIDARIVRILAPDMESSGTVSLDLRSAGSGSGPTIQGQLQLKDISMIPSDAPLGVSKLNGTIDIANDHVRISQLTGQMGGGELSIGGSIAYKPAVQFNLALQAKAVRLRYPDGLRSQLGANLAFSGTPQASTLNGRVVLENLSFTPDFDLAKFGDQFSTTDTPTQPGFADTVKLAIGVQSQENLNATSSQISIAGRAALEVGGTAANPVITGRTTLSSGELFYRNLRYQLQKGIITFDDPNTTHPVMNVSVTTIVEQYNLTLTMRGPLDKLTTSYVSDPPLATADIVNLVARGKTTQESNAQSQSTDSMIASQAASQVGSSVQKLAGISSLAIDPTIGGNNQNPSARVAIQQRITKNLLFTFSTDVSQPGSEIVQGEYQVNKRWSVSMARDQLGGVLVDGRYHKRF
jgi:translocation and assembly module TamB